MRVLLYILCRYCGVWKKMCVIFVPPIVIPEIEKWPNAAFVDMLKICSVPLALYLEYLVVKNVNITWIPPSTSRKNNLSQGLFNSAEPPVVEKITDEVSFIGTNCFVHPEISQFKRSKRVYVWGWVLFKSHIIAAECRSATLLLLCPADRLPKQTVVMHQFCCRISKGN